MAKQRMERLRSGEFQHKAHLLLFFSFFAAKFSIKRKRTRGEEKRERQLLVHKPWLAPLTGTSWLTCMIFRRQIRCVEAHTTVRKSEPALISKNFVLKRQGANREKGKEPGVTQRALERPSLLNDFSAFYLSCDHLNRMQLSRPCKCMRTAATRGVHCAHVNTATFPLIGSLRYKGGDDSGKPFRSREMNLPHSKNSASDLACRWWWISR